MNNHRRRADPVERYLRQLRWWLPPACRAEMLAEATRHLYDTTCRAERRGVPSVRAQRHAIAAFGPAWRLGLSMWRIENPASNRILRRIRLTLRQSLRKARRPRYKVIRAKRPGL